MKIAALEKLSLIDYPKLLSAIIFTQGCNFRCHYCYNPMLVWPQSDIRNKGKDYSHVLESDLFLFLEERKKKLEGVVITGGEPTLHADLPEFIKKIKKVGYKVKLDTNGTNPDMVARLVKDKLIDYIAMDFKAPLEEYYKVVNVKLDFNKIAKSVKIIRESGIDYEFRTTIVPGLLGSKEIEKMGKFLKGSRAWYLQQFKSETDLVNTKFRDKDPYTDDEMTQLTEIGKKFVKICQWR